ncbi:YihY/virulence factor BrkB family protein [Bradymonas sediminis]|uniref:Ribonuclease BN n=1 Tax=Bradymonas sediminis TaxID=1548548 RepID=A0A2Z4FLI2_9DELT|nr:YihY/virulence factor BrkB family protein [Bradymonas sediminis]AWV89606.1 ribonuclease BN [Bradymonas sediminis]
MNLSPLMRQKYKVLLEIARETTKRYQDDQVGRMAAAIAFYAVFSVAPLLVIATAVAGFVFDEQQVMDFVGRYLGHIIGGSTRDFIVELINNWQDEKKGILATLVGLGTLFWGAYRLFMALQDSLNVIWSVRPRRGLSVREWLKLRLAPFLMILLVALLLLLSMMVSIFFSGLQRFFSQTLTIPSGLITLGNIAISVTLLTVLTTAVFRVLPDVELKWRDVFSGAALTSLVFAMGNSLIGFYLGHTSTTSIFGASGSLVALLFWVYFSAQIFFAGAEFTRVNLERSGRMPAPQRHAIRVKRVVNLA